LLGAIGSLPFKTSDRNIKGFMWEKTCNELIAKVPNVKIIHQNPMEYKKWLKENQYSKFDAVVKSLNQIFTVEYKYREIPKVYHSWFMECWYTRHAKIFVVNNPNCIDYEHQRLLEKKGQRVMSLTEFIVFLGKASIPRKYTNTTIRNQFIYKNKLVSFREIKKVLRFKGYVTNDKNGS
jgi:hypothetical protein